MSALEEYLIHKPLLAILANLFICLTVVIVWSAIEKGNLNERIINDLNSKADTTYVQNAIRIHKEESENKIIEILIPIEEKLDSINKKLYSK